MTVCPSCSKELPGEFPFCPFCGVALTAASSGPIHEERKVVTVFFADLVGFTARAERLDPDLLSGIGGQWRAAEKTYVFGLRGARVETLARHSG